MTETSAVEQIVNGRDDLREVIDRACEATHKGDSPGAIAAYIWSNVGPLVADLESAVEEQEEGRTQAETRVRELYERLASKT